MCHLRFFASQRRHSTAAPAAAESQQSKKIVEIHSVDGQKRQAKQATGCIFHVLKLCDTLIVPKNSRSFIYLLFVE